MSKLFIAYQSSSNRLPQAVGFRAITDQDLPFLSQLYASTRADEMKAVPWSDAEKQQFLSMQFEAQHRYYQEHFQQAQFLIIEYQQQAIGRVYVDRRVDEIRLIDIALCPEQRQQGLGSALLKDLLQEATAYKLPIRIHVEQFNPALRLYERLGFTLVEDQGVYQFMEWVPSDDGSVESLAV
ncbi:MAG: GNAT family N-acetyltransferase [Xanthomonadales bacterium]|nr:GNAT family N-acetyltransferase [Xanthomonadales bacterium]